MRRLLTPAAVTLAAAALAAGCGGDEEDPLAAWADDACQALADWRTSAEDAAASVVSSPSRDSLQAAVGEIGTSTDTLRSTLDDLGAPPTESGDEVAAAFDTLAGQLSQRADTVESALDSGSGSLGDLANAVTVIGQEVQGAYTDVSTFLGQTPEPGSGLQETLDALRASESCDALG